MAETTTITKPEFADQLQPYVSAALTGSQDLYDAQVSAGYQGFGQPQVVGIGDDLSGATSSFGGEQIISTQTKLISGTFGFCSEIVKLILFDHP